MCFRFGSFPRCKNVNRDQSLLVTVILIIHDHTGNSSFVIKYARLKSVLTSSAEKSLHYGANGLREG